MCVPDERPGDARPPHAFDDLLGADRAAFVVGADRLAQLDGVDGLLATSVEDKGLAAIFVAHAVLLDWAFDGVS